MEFLLSRDRVYINHNDYESGAGSGFSNNEAMLWGQRDGQRGQPTSENCFEGDNRMH